MSLTMWRIGWRDLWQHPQRTILMVAIVAFGSGLIRDVRAITGLEGATALAVGLPSGVSANPSTAQADFTGSGSGPYTRSGSANACGEQAVQEPATVSPGEEESNQEESQNDGQC